MAHGSTGFSRMLKRLDFVEKSNKKYKETTDKKKLEEFFEEKDMKIVYLGREGITTERVSTMQLYPNWNLRTSSFEERGID